MRIDQRMRDALGADAQDIQPDTDAAFAELETAARRATVRRAGLLATAVAAALAAGIVWVPSILDSLSDAPDTEPVTEPEPAEETVELGWTSVDLDVVLHAGSVTPAGSGFVATRPSDPSGTTIVTSSDGMNWADAEDTNLTDSGHLNWLDGGDFGALGAIGDPEGSWEADQVLFSADGSQFVHSTVPVASVGHDTISGAAVGPSGVLVVATSGPPQSENSEQTALLFSADLTQWDPVDLEAPRQVSFWTAHASPIGYLALGAVNDAPDTYPIRAQYSPDGQDWVEIPLPQGQGDVISATGWRDGFVIVTQPSVAGQVEGIPMPEARSWEFVGGSSFTQMKSDDIADLVGPLVDGSSLGLAVMGGPPPDAPPDTQAEGPLLLFSADGETWQRSSSDALFGDPDIYGIDMGKTSLIATLVPDRDPPTETQLWIGAHERR